MIVEAKKNCDSCSNNANEIVNLVAIEDKQLKSIHGNNKKGKVNLHRKIV